MIRRTYVPYELALILKEKGYNEDSIYHYKKSSTTEQHSKIPTFEIKTMFGANHNILPTRVSAPLWTEVCDWIWKKSEHYILITYSPMLTIEELIQQFTNVLKLI